MPGLIIFLSSLCVSARIFPAAFISSISRLDLSVIIFSFPPKISTIYYYSSKPLRNKVIWKKGCSFSEDIYNRMYQLK
ncbi:hypothetical protein BLL53_14705, partial [Listeria monocytogenes]|nr:hypothetical protein [Listeria monocytogenes]